MDDDAIEKRFAREVAATPPDMDDDAEEDLRPLSSESREDEVPFPLQPVDSTPTVPNAVMALTVTSNLIRDTEIVEDQDERGRLFRMVLSAYGRLASMIEADDYFRAGAKQAAEELAESLKVPSGHRLDRFIDDVVAMLPLSIAFAGVSVALSTNKLRRLIQRCLEDEDFASDPVAMVFAHYVLFDVAGPGWTTPLPHLHSRHGGIGAVNGVTRKMAMFAFVRQPQLPEDEANLQDFLVDQTLRGAKETGVELGRRRSNAIESLRRARLVNSPRLTTSTPEDEDDEPLVN